MLGLGLAIAMALAGGEAHKPILTLASDFYVVEAPDLYDAYRDLKDGGESQSGRNVPFDAKVAEQAVARVNSLWSQCGIQIQMGRVKRAPVESAQQLASDGSRIKQFERTLLKRHLASERNGYAISKVLATYQAAGERLAKLVFNKRSLEQLPQGRFPVIVLPVAQLTSVSTTPSYTVTEMSEPSIRRALAGKSDSELSISKSYFVVYGYDADAAVGNSHQGAINEAVDGSADILGHELGHFLGLGHAGSKQLKNLMHPSSGGKRLSADQCRAARAFLMKKIPAPA